MVSILLSPHRVTRSGQYLAFDKSSVTKDYFVQNFTVYIMIILNSI